MKKNLLLWLCFLLAQQMCLACANEQASQGSTVPNEASLNWASTSQWYEGDVRLTKMNASEPDVFYLLPTCVSTWTDSTGLTHYNADPTSEAHRQAWKLSAELADTIFATRANLFLPYYRQATFEGLVGEHAEQALELAKCDVLQAFDYYLHHLNQGRPFILAGYSQGAQWVKELLKNMDDATYSRLVAAYLVGYGVTAQDTVRQACHKRSHLRLATDSTAQGVTICFNSVTTPEAIAPLLCTGNIACINPVTWTTSPQPATLLAAGEKAKADDTRFPYATAVRASAANEAVTVSIDADNHVLVVSGVDANRYFLPTLQNFFPVGNLHLQELFFYGDALRRNVLLRSHQ